MKLTMKTGQYLGNVLGVFLFSFLFFCVTLPELKIYLILFLVLWISAFFSYRKKDNQLFYQGVLKIALGNVSAYMLQKLLHQASWSGIDKIEWIGIVCCGLEVFVGLCFIYNKAQCKNETEELELFADRKYDLERIRDFIRKVPVLGINAQWGEGKTFLVRKLCKDVRIMEEFEIIQIDLLTCNLDEIEGLLLGELDRILHRNRIFSKSSKQLKKMLGSNALLEQIQNLFINADQSVSATFGDLKKDICKLKKKILIIYDDIDRINNQEIIKKIFAISEKLAGKEIHIVYQYENHNLGIERDYLEKYIPFTVNLTEIKFRDIVKALWKELDMEELGLKVEDVQAIVDTPLYIQSVNKTLCCNVAYTLTVKNISVRRVRIFLQEIKTLSQQNEVYCQKQNVGLVVSILFIKNFMYEYYEKFSLGDSVADTLKFEYQDKFYNMHQLIHQYKSKEFSLEDIQELFLSTENRNVYVILAMLGYNFYMEDSRKDREGFANESIQSIKIRNANEKIDRFIWNMIGNGYSEFTDMETFVRILCKEVLDESIEDKSQAWKKFQSDAYYEQLWKNNQTLFRIGCDEYLPVFQAFRVVGATKSQWVLLIHFYFEQVQEKGITVEMIEALNYCDLHYKDVYIEVLKGMNQCPIKGNMNQEKCIKLFLKNYVGAILSLGYSDSYIFETWRYEVEDKISTRIEHINCILEEALHVLEEEMNHNIIPTLMTELELISSFVSKCRQIINARNVVKPRQLRVQTSVKTVAENEEEFRRLRDILDNHREIFEDEISRSYEAGKINPREVRELYKAYTTDV